MRGEAAPAPLIVLPIKFVGGVLAIGSGLVLGREGPTVQMGATLGARLAELVALDDARVRIVQSAAAGAGLAVAFNTPLGGIAFVFEELVRRFSTQVMVATLAACGTAVIVARVLLGNDVDFVVAPLAPPSGAAVGECLVLGIILGVLGAAYNRTILLALAGFAALPGVPVPWRAAAVGGGVGLVAWFEPRLVGGGDPLIQAVLTTHPSLSLLATVLVVRWLLGPLSYAAGTPGGLFAPLLVIGAVVGAIVAQMGNAVVPALAMSPALGAIVGMAAFFAAVVRAPLTGILLVLGMTGTIEPLVPMVAACLMATIVPFAVGSPPIYDTLRERMEHPAPVVPYRRQTAPQP
jgi:chloride channel protein, CIC family